MDHMVRRDSVCQDVLEGQDVQSRLGVWLVWMWADDPALPFPLLMTPNLTTNPLLAEVARTLSLCKHQQTRQTSRPADVVVNPTGQ